MKKILTILTWLLTALPCALTAQPDFDVLDMRNGLPETRIRALCQMPDGRMAIATAGTVTISDGTRFTTYRLRPQDEYPLKGYHGLRHLTCDSTGMVWLRGDGSLYVIDTRRHRVVHSVDSLLAHRQLTAQQVSQWPAGDTWRHSADYRIVSQLVDDEICALVRDSYGALWVGLKESGLLYSNPARKRQFHATTDAFTHKSLFPFCSARASQLSARFAPKATNCSLEGRALHYAYLGTRNGIMIVDREDRLVATLDERDGMATDNVVALMADRHGDVWAATANGLTRIRQTGRDSFSIANFGPLDGVNTGGREFRTCQMHRDSTGFIAVGFAGGTVTFHPDSVCAPRYTFHFPRDEQDADGHSAGTASSGLCWWAILLAVALGIVLGATLGVAALRAKRRPAAAPPHQTATPGETAVGQVLAQDIARQTAAEQLSSADLQFLDRLKAAVEQHIGDEDFSVQALSQMMAMDRTVLYRRMQTLTGVSPSVYVKNIRMDIARRLLRDTDLSVGDIATKTGFATTKYFSAAFKDAFGMSPNEFRAQ